MAVTTTHFVVTGATGFVGRHLAYGLFAEPNARLTLLVRGTDCAQARTRALSALRAAARDGGRILDEQRAASRIDVVPCDVSEPNCGVPLPVPARDPGERVEFWHVAASLCFEEKHRDVIWAQNVTGTRNAVELAAALGAERFVYISTAYSCGQSAGDITERLHSADGPFNNAYERSKCAAEHLASRTCAAQGIDCRIVRPSIVLGTRSSYAPSGSDSGLYGFIRQLLRLRPALRRAPAPPRLIADREALLNFVPVDVMVEQTLALARAGFPAGPVYHVTSGHCPSVGETLDAVCDALEVPRFEFVSSLEGESMPLERLIGRRMSFYSSYLRGTKAFARELGPAFGVSAGDVRAFVAGYFREHATATPGGERRVLARDGFPVFTAGSVRRGRETVVLANAMGMPRAALSSLEQALSERYSVLTWQSRGAPAMDGALDDESARCSRHADDLEDLLAAHGVDRAHVVGWCTGADIALEFARRSPRRVLSLSCLNGAFMGLSSARTAYQRGLERIVRRAATSASHARMFHALIGESLGAVSEPVQASEECRDSIRLAVSVLDPELMHITGVALRSPEVLQRYCLLLKHYFDDGPRELPGSRLPMLVVSAQDDPIAHPEASRELAARMHAELRMSRTGGHFAPCKDAASIAAVLSFIERHGASDVSFRKSARAPGQLSTASGPSAPSSPAA